MEIKNRLFPYPVLCSETDDYIDEEFDVSCSIESEINDIRGTVIFQLVNEELLDLIRSGYAEYAVHIECSSTSYRKVLRSAANRIPFTIPLSKVKDTITVLALLVAKRPITGFSSKSLNEDYLGETISFEKASILAYLNLPKINVFKNYEELQGNESLFSIIKKGLPDSDEIEPLTFDINGDYIKIFVDPGTYNAYLRLQQKQPLAISMLALPALIFALDELRMGTEPFLNKRWYNMISQYYAAHGKSFDEELTGDKNIVEIAQDMLKSPIGKAYKVLLEEEE